MQIDWWTLAIQAVNFLVLVWLLSRVLYRPVRKVVAARQARSAEALDAAKAKADASEAARRDYEAKAEALVRERRDMAAELHKQADAERARMLETAEAEAAKMKDEAREALEAERARAVEAVRGEVVGLAREMAARLLRESGAPSLDGALEAVSAHLDGLDDARRAELRRDAAGGVTVLTAAAPGDAVRGRWAAAVKDWFGAERAAFEVDEALLGGVRLRLPHAVLDFSWAGRLDAAAARMEGGDEP